MWFTIWPIVGLAGFVIGLVRDTINLFK